MLRAKVALFTSAALRSTSIGLRLMKEYGLADGTRSVLRKTYGMRKAMDGVSSLISIWWALTTTYVCLLNHQQIDRLTTPQLFWDDDGQVYLSSTYRMRNRTPVPVGSKQLKDFAIHICKVDLRTGRSLTAPQLIRSSSSGVSEGSHIIKRGKYYYLFTAEGGTESGHSEYVSRSTTGPLGPWELGGKLVSSGVGVDDGVQNTGHCDLIEDDQGRWWAVLLAVRPRKTDDGAWETSVFGKSTMIHHMRLLTSHLLGRETFLIPVTWKDDWPVFNEEKQVTIAGKASGLYEHEHDPTWRDDFEDAAGMQLGWYRKSTPQVNDWSLSERPGYLRLWGGPYVLSTPTCATMWLRKQTHRYITFETKLGFRPKSKYTQAGVVVWWNCGCLSSMGISVADDNVQQRVMKLRLADGTCHEVPLESSTDEVVLTIRCGSKYEFGFSEVGVAVRWIGSVSNDIMTRDPEVGAPFTGMMIGLYAHGDLEPVLVPADFAYAKFEKAE